MLYICHNNLSPTNNYGRCITSGKCIRFVGISFKAVITDWWDKQHKATTNCIVVSRPGYGSTIACGRAWIFIIHYGCGKGNTSHKVL